MSEEFHQYNLIETLSKKYSHTTYLASPMDEPEHQVIITVFSSSLFRFPFPNESERLLQEAQRIQQLQHPRLVPILDVGIEKGQPFVVREYLPSTSLRGHLKRLFPRRLKLANALTVVLQVGEALAYVHQHHIVHGNVKPENIFFESNGQAVLADFNLVTRKDVIIRNQTAEEYAFCYMAPERFAGIYDAKSDQYALGCLTYELIAGRVPFAAQSLSSIIGRQNNALPAPLSESVANLPTSLEAAVLKTLAQDPAERFFDFSLFLEVIRAILSPPPAFPLTRSDRSRGDKAIAYPAALAEAKDISSSIGKHATMPNPVAQSPELSGASSNAKVDATNSLSSPYLSQISLPEWTGIIPFPYESLTLALQSYQFVSLLSDETETRVQQGPTTAHGNGNEWVFPAETRMRQEPTTAHGNDNERIFSEHIYPLGDRENASPNRPLEVHGPNRSSTIKPEETRQLGVPVAKQHMTTGMTDKQSNDLLLDSFLIREETGASPAIAFADSFHGYSESAAAEATLGLRRSLDIGERWPVPLLVGKKRVLGLVLVLLLIGALIAYIFLPMVMTRSSTSLQTGNKRQEIIATSTSAASISIFAKIQSSATNTPMMQPVVPVTHSASASFVPVPTSYEAESSQNMLTNGARVISCSGCSGGYKVGYIGMKARYRKNVDGTLLFNNVNKSSAGSYLLTIYYINGASSSRSGYVSVNSEPTVVFNGSPTGSWNTVGKLNIRISLRIRSNTIEFSNLYDRAPDIDRIVV